MVKQLLTKFALLAVMLVGVGSAWAEDVVYKTAKFGVSYNSKPITDYTSTWTATNSGFTVSLTNFNNNGNQWEYVKCGRKNNASIGTITTSAAIDKAITKVVVTIDALTGSKINSIKLYTSSNNSTWTEAGSFGKTASAQTVTLASPTENLYYKIEFDCASGSSNGLVTVSKIEYYYDNSAAADPSVATTVTIDDTGITNTDVYTSTDAGTLAATVKAGDTTIDGATVTWTSDNTAVATVGETTGVVTLVAAGTANITATYAGVANTYKSSFNTYELTVTDSDPNPSGTENNPYTVVQAKANTPSSGNVYIKGIVSAFYNTSIVSDGSNYRYYISDNGTTTNQLLVYKGKGLNEATFTSADDLLIGDEVVIYGSLITYNSAPEIASGNYLYSRKTKNDPELSYATTSFDVKLAEIGSFTAPSLVNPNSLTVVYSSDNEDVASVDVSTGVVTLKGVVGSATITAEFAGNSTYYAGSASYIINVYEPVVFSEFYESFDTNDGIDGWSGSAAAKTFVSDNVWTTEKEYGGYMCARFGTGSGQGVATTPVLHFDNATDYVLTFNAGAWNGDNTTLTLVSADAIFGGNTSTTVAMVNNAWKGYYIELSGGTATTTITFRGATSKGRFFLDEVRVMEKSAYEALTASKTVESYGWATYIPNYNVEFESGDAWVITDASVSGGLTLEEVTKVPAKTPVLLKGADTKTITINSDANVAAPATNLLMISNGSALASGNYPYVLAKDGTGAAFKQWTGEVSVLKDRVMLVLDEDVATARSFFMLDDEATSISSAKVSQSTEQVYDLQGRRVAQPTKGLYIVNGKKMILK